MGWKRFDPNAPGEVLTEQDINPDGSPCTGTGCDTITMAYDVLGRQVGRYANGLRVGRWVYDNPAPDKGLGLLDVEESYLGGAHGLQKHYFYALTGSPRKDLTRVVHRFYENGSPHTDYEIRHYTDGYYGRPKGLRYEGGVGVAYVYNTNGYLVQEKDASSSYVLRQVTARDSRHQVLAATLANGSLSQTATYAAATGQMQSITVTGAARPVHGLTYDYDNYGNLHLRSKEFNGALSTETLWYDVLHRLRESNRVTPGGSQTVHYAYDASGNLTLKDDYASAYFYQDARPNAVSSITKLGGGTVTFAYDANGNLLSGDAKTLTYNAFNQPLTITAGGVTASFGYGADLARYRQDKSSGETTLYVGKLMEIVRVGTAVDYRHYLGGVAILTKTGALNDPAPSLRFVHRDRLGSVVTITGGPDPEGRGYDPFGKPRDADWSDKAPPVLGSTVTDRGFTDHEHLDASRLIHMNGRVYDYNLGRFLSVDPIIQAPGNSQSLNPYSYIMNNPLAGTDPSGYQAIVEECQAKPVSCRAVMAAEYGGMNSGLIGNFGMPGYRGQLLAGSNGASLGHARQSPKGHVQIVPDEIESTMGRSAASNVTSPSAEPATADASSNESVTWSGGESTDDVVGNPLLDRVVQFAALAFKYNRKEQSREINETEEGWEFTEIRVGESDSESTILVRSSTVAGLHTHVRVPGNRAINLQRELPGPGDHVLVDRGRIPNYFITPAGNIRVLERVSGQYRVRTVLGNDAKGQAKWKPGTCTSKGECSF